MAVILMEVAMIPLMSKVKNLGKQMGSSMPQIKMIKKEIFLMKIDLGIKELIKIFNVHIK